MKIRKIYDIMSQIFFDQLILWVNIIKSEFIDD